MSCDDCEKLFDQDCEDEKCIDQRRRNRTALFDYMMCVQMEEQFEGEINGS